MIKLTIQKELTGHCWRGSSAETSNSCGNCDGANCDDCFKTFNVYDKETCKKVYSTEEYESAKTLVDENDDKIIYLEIDFRYNSSTLKHSKELYHAIKDRFKYDIINVIQDDNLELLQYSIISSLDENKHLLENTQSLLDSCNVPFTINRFETNNISLPQIIPMMRINVLNHNARQIVANNAYLNMTFQIKPNGYVMVKEVPKHDSLELADGLLNINWSNWNKEQQPENIYVLSPSIYGQILNIDGTDEYCLYDGLKWVTYKGYNHAYSEIKHEWGV